MAMGENEQGFWAGGLSGAGTGAIAGSMVAPGIGTAIGAGIGFIAGGLIGSETADSQRRAKKNAQKEAEKARRMALMREMGAKQQADNIAMAGLQKNKSTPKSSGASSQATGAIGGNMTTTAGTF